MHFRKPALTPQQQLDRLIGRGLQVRDAGRALRLLEDTSYFRLIPYMRPFQDLSADSRRFQPGGARLMKLTADKYLADLTRNGAEA